MRSYRLLTLGLVGMVSTLLVAGCPTNTGDPNQTTDPDPAITGTWTGTLDCTTTGTFTVNGFEFPRATREASAEFSITFDGDAMPTKLPIWGFDSAFTSEGENTTVGESETFTVTFTTAERTVTLVATIDSATFTETGMTVVMSLTYSAEDPNLTQEGTGTMTITAAVTDAGLEYSGIATYSLTITNVATEATAVDDQTITCTGTLTLQEEEE